MTAGTAKNACKHRIGMKNNYTEELIKVAEGPSKCQLFNPIHFLQLKNHHTSNNKCWGNSPDKSEKQKSCEIEGFCKESGPHPFSLEFPISIISLVVSFSSLTTS